MNTSGPPGFRYGTSGAASNSGSSGFGYSASVSSSQGMYLDFHAAGLTPSNSDGRAFGFPLRCLSRPQGVLLAASTQKLAGTTPRGSRYPKATPSNWPPRPKSFRMPNGPRQSIYGIERTPLPVFYRKN
ncbi:hypothetical protein [uncultured Rikenella sp.]|uniref:hypothetical protein n=2 Tax=uncultured Rikenella sp. TaxID=368003 RepID=UPI002614EE84|nr:hypothetical protein [uncultured Rikenella sp.]